MNYIDLFAGAGGLSEGFIQAGFEPVAHIEMNKDASDTLKTRTCYHYLRANGNLRNYKRYLQGRITREQLYALVPAEELNSVLNVEISEKTINGIFDDVDELLARKADWNNEVDVIVGGPPCQAYSLIGRAVKDDNMVGDPRNFLYKMYCRFLNRYRPKMFVFENVPGLKTAKKGEYFRNLQTYMKHVGYRIEARDLNACEYGVLQSRKRVIIVGWRNDLDLGFPNLAAVAHNYTVNDILYDLRAIEPGKEDNRYKPVKRSPYLGAFGIRDNDDVLTWHVARPHIDRDRKIYRKAIELWNDGHKRLNYKSLPKKLRTHKNVTAFLDRFKVVEGDTATCHTMMAHISKDGHYFIHPDINQARSITVREAARIQSFPDNYYFEGSRTAAFTQIGNAVPPLMAQAIATGIRNLLEN
ncbi:MAG: DNA cytosine methyltransferase [Clostridia bacterium]|nr:DNA cytosine methyltransferase [Clostridia bacterium]